MGELAIRLSVEYSLLSLANDQRLSAAGLIRRDGRGCVARQLQTGIDIARRFANLITDAILIEGYFAA